MVDSKLSGFNGFAVLIQVSPKKKKGLSSFHLLIDCFVFYFVYLFVVFHVSIMK